MRFRAQRHGCPRAFRARLRQSTYMGGGDAQVVNQARIASSQAKPMNAASPSMGVKYQTPRKKSQLPSFRKLQSCTRKCLRQKSDGTICRLSKSGVPASARGEDRNTFVNAVVAIIILYQNERNKIKILLRSMRICAIITASIRLTGGSYAAIP